MWANYNSMTSSELEEHRNYFEEKLMMSNNTAEIELLNQEIESIEDILDERDPMIED